MFVGEEKGVVNVTVISGKLSASVSLVTMYWALQGAVVVTVGFSLLSHNGHGFAGLLLHQVSSGFYLVL